jgi:carbonic anhydrase
MRIVIISLIVAVLSLTAIFLMDSEEDRVSHEVGVSSGGSVVASQKTAPESAAEQPQNQSGDPAGHVGMQAPDVASPHAETASHQLHWSYQGEEGPSNWGKLSPEYVMCGSGLNQSPINLTNFIEADLPLLTFNYSGMVMEILNNGHTVQANYHPGSNLVVDGRIFELKQFHFHAPSENLLNGKSYPLEAHFVHVDSQGNLAVVAVLFYSGDANPSLAQLWDQLPQAGQSENQVTQVKASDLLPQDRSYYRFNGSLTTPPCSQGVIWLVMKQPLSVSSAQVETFSRLMGGPNNRPVQPLNARVVMQ